MLQFEVHVDLEGRVDGYCVCVRRRGCVCLGGGESVEFEVSEWNGILLDGVLVRW